MAYYQGLRDILMALNLNVMERTLTKCPLCGSPAIKEFPQIMAHKYYIQCDRCGEYEISDKFIIFRDVGEELSKVGYILSGLARELHETDGEAPNFTYENLETSLKHHLIPDVKNIEEKIQKLIQRIREKTSYFGEEIELGNMESVVPLAYAKNVKELKALLNLISGKRIASVKFVERSAAGIPVTDVKVVLSADGWDLGNKIDSKNKESERGFVAAWFDDSMDENITAAEEAISESGFIPVCIRDKHFSERIMDKALGEIRRSRFVIVDLTGNRGSVFFEAGFAFGLGIETIYVYHEKHSGKNTPLEFYVKHYQCYKYQTPADLKETIKSAISSRIKVPKQ